MAEKKESSIIHALYARNSNYSKVAAVACEGLHWYALHNTQVHLVASLIAYALERNSNFFLILSSFPFYTILYIYNTETLITISRSKKAYYYFQIRVATTTSTYIYRCGNSIRFTDRKGKLINGSVIIIRLCGARECKINNYDKKTSSCGSFEKEKRKVAMIDIRDFSSN